VELEVFLDDSLDEGQIQEMADKIKRFAGVQDLTFISKEMAIYEYKNLFKEKQEDYFEVLGYNPLPASFRVKLAEDYRNSAGAEKVFKYLSSISNIEEHDIVYRREYVIMLEKHLNVAIAAVFIVGVILGLSALLLVSNNIRLIILTRQRIIETMKLVGATRFFVQMPLYIQGVIEGFLGGAFAALFLYALLRLAEVEIPGYIVMDLRMYMMLVNLGILLGLSGSFMAVRRYL
ncbi:MAG TPA: permease-like cell division protein FtsX, partial [bacterium]